MVPAYSLGAMLTVYFDLVEHTKKYKGDLHGFFLSMSAWRTFKTRYKLTWQRERFAEANHGKIPQERGIYAFTVELSPSKLPPHGYILYVGITGDTSAATLRSRFAQYVGHLKKKDGRPAVLYMLDNWSGDLFFNFVPMPNKNVDLAKLEKAVINAIMPPVNKRDFEADIAAPKAAAF